MPSKKKKYNSRFPPARIKKIMQTDEDIGKVAAAVPVLISKCLEMFLTSLLTKAGDVTKSKRAKTMSRMHLKECIMSETMFDFLKDQVAHIQDLQGDDEPAMSSGFVADSEISSKLTRKRSLQKSKKGTKKRAKLNEESGHESDGRNDSDDGMSNEITEPSYSSGLFSNKSEMELGIKSSTNHEGEASSSKQSRSMHIPLDLLMAEKEIPTSAKVERSPSLQNRNTISTGTKLEHNAESFRRLETSTESNPLKFDSPVRQGVIVTNSSAHPTNYTSPTFAQTAYVGGHAPKQESIVARPAETFAKDAVTEDGQRKVLPGNYPTADSQRESMLSLLQSSMPVPAPITPDSPTVPSNTPGSHQKYAYNPLSQQPRPPVYFSNLQASVNGGPASSYPKQIPPYIPPATQRHFLGYPQTMLTPPGQNPMLAVHSGMAQMKPAPRKRSDDDDDYDT